MAGIWIDGALKMSRINLDNFYTRKQLADLGVKQREIPIWFDLPDGRSKEGHLYDRDRCDQVLTSDNWKAWTSGKGYVMQASKKSVPVALVMTAPRQYIGKAVWRNGKWHPRVFLNAWRSFPGAIGCETLDECRALIESYNIPSYEEWQRAHC